MPDLEQKPESDFMLEKIKERPVNKKKLLRRSIITASMAVIFGLIACLTFLILEPVFNNWLYPEEKPQIVEFPEETEEVLPENMLVEEPALENQGEVTLEDDQIQEILSGIEWSVEDYRALYSSMSAYVQTLNSSMVTVTGAVSNVDWFNEAYESEGAVSGLVVANNGKELLILADRTDIDKAETISVTFYDGSRAEATAKQYDANTNLAIVAVPITSIDTELMKTIQIANLGISNGVNLQGTPIVVLGSPTGNAGSVAYGTITAAGISLYKPDANYKTFMTNIYGSQSANGIIFNLQGQVLGVVNMQNNATDMKNMISGIGISELKKLIASMSNNIEIAYMGIIGMDVTTQAHEDLDVPLGAYVREVEMDSPAMLAGIQSGDIITQIDESEVLNFSEYTTAMLEKEPGDTVKVQLFREAQNDYKEMEFEIALTSGK